MKDPNQCHPSGSCTQRNLSFLALCLASAGILQVNFSLAASLSILDNATIPDINGIIGKAAYSYATAVSGDGSVVVGDAYDSTTNQHFVFTWDGTNAPAYEAGNSTNNYVGLKLSDDGHNLAGSYYSGSTYQAFVYDMVAHVVTNLPITQVVAGVGTGAKARGISYDGTVVVGEEYPNGSFSSTPVYWQGGNDHALSVNSLDPGAMGGTASAANLDGTVIVGTWFDSHGFESPAYWNGFGGPGLYNMSSLPTVGGLSGSALDVSGDGKVVVGYSQDASSSNHATLWSIPTPNAANIGLPTTLDLGIFPNTDNSAATAVSKDGSVAVGWSNDSVTNKFTPLRWAYDSVHGTASMQSINQWLAANGITSNIDEGQSLGVNADGSVVVGSYYDGSENHAFIARVDSGTGSGVIDLTNYNPTLVEAGSLTARGSVNMPSLTLFGAHHRSLLDLGVHSKESETCAWGVVDAASFHHDDTRVELTEAGACKDFGNMHAGLGVGQTWAQQDWLNGGKARYDGQYLIGELASRLDNGLEVSATGYYGAFNTRLNRNYLNGVNIDSSTGTPDSQSTAARIKLDWRDMVKGTLGLSPYMAYTWIHSRVDAYTETGGGFPAQFDKSDWTTNDLRAGIRADRQVSTKTNLVLTGELIHQFNGSTNGVKGQVIGLNAFSLPGENETKNGVRISADLDTQISKQITLSVGANLGTSGNAYPAYGITSSLKSVF